MQRLTESEGYKAKDNGAQPITSIVLSMPMLTKVGAFEALYETKILSYNQVASSELLGVIHGRINLLT